MNIEGKTVVVTGGASGLGKATVEYVVKLGAKAAILDISDEGQKIADELGENAFFVKTDVGEEPAIEAAVAAVLEHFGQIDVVVTCAAYDGMGKVYNPKHGKYPEDKWEKIVKVNLGGTYQMVRNTIEPMSKNEPNEEGERGVIIMVASCAGHDGQTGQVQYAATKGAILSMTLPLARELGNYGIRVMSISPGSFDTPMFAVIPPENREKTIADVPFPRRMGKPEEFAQTVVDIVENPMLNGCDIRVDGAMRLKYM